MNVFSVKVKKGVSVLLSVLMLLSAVYVAGAAFPMEARAQTPAEEGTVTTVVACSDYQYPNTDEYGVGATGNAGGAILIKRIASQMQSAGFSNVDGFICAGDFDYDLNRTESDTAAGVQSMTAAVTESGLTGSATHYVNVQGNHDPTSTAGGTSPSGDNDPASGAYGVFVINERDYQWASTGVDEAATLALCETMRRYFNAKIAVNYTAPIFVMSHLPLHYSMRTKNDGDNVYAKDIFDVLQNAADHGLHIIFMFGHNHSNGWDDYLGGANIFLAPGSSINIAENGSRTAYTAETLKFTYMNAGYVGYYKHHNTASGSIGSTPTYDIADMTMTSFEISGSEVVIKRFNTTGQTELKKAGIYNYYKYENSSVSYTPDTTVVSGSYTLSLTNVPDTEYEIGPVVEAEVGADNTVKVYPRITDVSQLMNGGKYVLICTGATGGSNTTYTQSSSKRMLSQNVIAGSRTGFEIVVNNSLSLDSTITGAHSAFEWTFNGSGDNWTLSNDEGSFYLSQNSSSTSSYDASLSANSATTLTVSQLNNTADGVLFRLEATVGSTAVVIEKNTDRGIFNGYKKSSSTNFATFAIYGDKSGSTYTENAYVLQDVSSTADLEKDATYLIVSGNEAVYASSDYTAIPVNIETDANGTQYIGYGNSSDLEWKWVNAAGDSYRNFRSNQEGKWMEISRTGGSYITTTTETTSYNQATSFENNGVYVIVSDGYALTAESANTNNTRLKRTSVTVSGNTVTASDYSDIEWTYSSNQLKAGNGKYLSFTDTSGISLQNSGSNVEYNSNKLLRYNRGSNKYYYIRSNNSGYFDRTDKNNNASQFSLYKKTVTQTTTQVLDPNSNFTYSLGTGSDTSKYVTVTSSTRALGDTAKIYLNGHDDYDYGKYLALSGNSFVFADTGSDFNFYKYVSSGITLTSGDTPISLAANQPGSSSAISSVTLSDTEASIYPGASASTYTGLYFNVVYSDDPDTVVQIPIKVGDLIDYSGHNNVASYCDEAGDVTGLGAYYNALDGYWFSDLILHLIQKEDYPEYPNEGSVRVNKTSGSPNFLTNGVTQVELTATGVPMTKGIDIVLMVDTSSSMTSRLDGYTSSDVVYDKNGNNVGSTSGEYTADGTPAKRISVLRESVIAMLQYMAKPNATTGLIPDITMAIADFNGYYDTATGEQTYVSASDIPTGGSGRSGTSAQHCTILTGPNAGSETYNNDAFIPVSELADADGANYFDGSAISCKSGTNYDAAFQTIYKLFEARQAYNAAQQAERETVVIFMSDGAPFQYNFYTSGSGSSCIAWNDWLQGTYDDSTAEGLADLKEHFNDNHWYFYNGVGNPNRFAEAVKGDPDKLYTVLTKDETAFCNDRDSNGFCDLCGKCTAGCHDGDGDGYCDACGHIDECAHTDVDNNGFCDIEGCGECMDGCRTYQYLTQVHGLGATMYSIMFCKAVDNAITTETMDAVITGIASDESKAYPDADSADSLTNAFIEIASNYVQAGSNAYFVDIMGAAYDIQLATVFTKNNGEFEQTYTLDPAPTIEVKKYTVYTRADYEKDVIADENMIGMRTGEVETIETVSFDPYGTEGYSDQIDNGATNIYVNGIISAKYFVYNNTPSAVMIDTNGDGVNDYSLPAETFYWKIGIIEDKEFALTYWLYLTGSMEGTRDPGSFQTNTAAILYYDNYLGHPCYQETTSPVQAWKAANITFEFYLVNDLGQPVNSAGTVVPFANRVLIGNRQTETFNLNSNDSQTAQNLFEVAAADLPDIYTLFSPDSKFSVALYSGDDSNINRAIIYDPVTIKTTYYFDTGVNWCCTADGSDQQDVPEAYVVDYTSTHVAFGVKLTTTIVPDAVVIDYGIPVRIHVLMNDLNLATGTRIRAIGTSLAEGTETNKAYSESRLVNGGQAVEFDHGTATVVNGDTSADTYVLYSSTDMQMDSEAVLYYEIYLRSAYYYSTVTVIPAANIYYEDSFLEFIDGTGADAAYKWDVAGEAYTDKYQAEDRPGYFALSTYDANNVYGNDAAYDDETATYSLGSARFVTLDSGCKPTPDISPRAEFDFCGTGFDVISITSAYTGALTVTVTNKETGEQVNKQVVNTFYGYSYGRLYLNAAGTVTLAETDDDGNKNAPLYYFSESANHYVPTADADEQIVRVNGRLFTTKRHLDENDQPYDYAYGWLTEGTPNGILYQIPVLFVKGLDYGTYHVTLQPRYAKMFDVANAGSYEVYVDAIRTYDPAGTGEKISTVVAEAYNEDNESDPIFAEVRDTVIGDKDNFLKQTEGVGETAVGGTIMVDGMFVTAGSHNALANLTQSGPNNEMYLAQYQAIAFKPAVISATAPSSFQLGMKVAITGTDAETETAKPSVASVRIIISDVKRQMIKQIYSLTVSGAAEQFYDLSKLLSWTKAEDSDTYICDYDIVILNDSDVVLSLTKFKTTFAKSAEAEASAVEPEYALSSTKRTLSFAARAIKQVLSSADTSTLKIEWLDEDLTAGVEATLTVTVSDEITAVRIGDTEVTEYVQNEDGTRTFTYTFTVVENGDDTFSVILRDAFGRESAAYTAEIPLAEPETTPAEDPTEPAEDPTNPTDPTNPVAPTEITVPTEPTTSDGDQSGSSGSGSSQKGVSKFLSWLIALFRRIISFFK